jgi:hypothetical protein
MIRQASSRELLTLTEIAEAFVNQQAASTLDEGNEEKSNEPGSSAGFATDARSSSHSYPGGRPQLAQERPEVSRPIFLCATPS